MVLGIVIVLYRRNANRISSRKSDYFLSFNNSKFQYLLNPCIG